VVPPPDTPSAGLAAEWRASHFAEFAGAALDLRLPVSQSVFNGVLAREVLPRVPALRRLSVQILPGNRLEISAASAALAWLPALKAPVMLRPDIEPGPRVRLEVHGGGIAALLTSLAGTIGGHPRGIIVRDRVVDIDVAEFLPPPDGETLRRWFAGGSITTEAGVLWLAVRLSRPESGTR
jgi:hypothetical protein